VKRRPAFVERMVDRPVVPLVAIVALSVMVRGWIGLGVQSPWVLPDELLYSELARSIADGDRPSVHGVPVFGWGEVYPLLIAPAWALFDDSFLAYHATLLINALVMSLAAVPAYLLARLYVSSRSALLVSGLTVLVPSLAYTGAVLTENAFYPLFLFAVLTIARAIQRPTIGSQMLVLLALGLLALTRIQGVVLVVAYLAAIVVSVMTQPHPNRLSSLRRFTPTAAILLPLSAVPLCVSLVRGHGAIGWLGARKGALAGLELREVPQWFVFLAADLMLYVAVVPAAASLIVIGLGFSRRASEPVRLFAAVSLPVFLVMLLAVALVSASFDVDRIGNLNERYVFYVVPLMFVGLAVWIEAALPKPRPWAFLVAAGSCLLVALLPIDRLDYNAGLQALALVPWEPLSLAGPGLALVVGFLAVASAAVWLTCRPRHVRRLWLLVATSMLLLGLFAVESNAVSAKRTAMAFDSQRATWVDDAVPEGAEVVVLWNETAARHDSTNGFTFWLMVTELFNRSVVRVYRIGPPARYEDTLPSVSVRVGLGGTIVDERGRALRSHFVLSTCRTPVVGRIVAEAPRGVLTLVATRGPIRRSTRPPCSQVGF